MAGKKKNEAVLKSWIAGGLAKGDIGDGAWGWTSDAKAWIPGRLLSLLSDLLYGDASPYMVSLHKKELAKFGFKEDGTWEEEPPGYGSAPAQLVHHEPNCRCSACVMRTM